MIRYLLIVALLLFASVFAITQFSQSRPAVVAGISLQEALSDKSGLFAKVVPGRKFQFPSDHGPHRDFKTEWWYFTGNLLDENGDHFGYQLTLFRVGNLPPGQPKSPSEWASQSLFMGHVGLSDTAREKFYTRERLGREGVGLAGALANGERVWLEDWEILRRPEGWELKAKSDDISLSLTLTDVKPPTLQGDSGYSRKGPDERHASYYVSQTRLETAGNLEIQGQTHSVSGFSWFDHEWSSEAMAEGLVGWDWFSLQLEDQTELMLYLLRYQDGRLEPASSGAFIRADGTKVHLALDQFEVVKLSETSVESGNTYPSKWRVRVPSEELEIEVQPTMAEQEMSGRVPYWEGAVLVEGHRAGKALSGRGFVELTGYAGVLEK
jgi:predicted secreted hydrolase